MLYPLSMHAKVFIVFSVIAGCPIPSSLEYNILQLTLLDGADDTAPSSPQRDQSSDSGGAQHAASPTPSAQLFVPNISLAVAAAELLGPPQPVSSEVSGGVAPGVPTAASSQSAASSQPAASSQSAASSGGVECPASSVTISNGLAAAILSDLNEYTSGVSLPGMLTIENSYLDENDVLDHLRGDSPIPE